MTTANLFRVPYHPTPAKPAKGDGCRTASQRERWPHGRTRLAEFTALSPLQGQILAWVLGHERNGEFTRHRAAWRLLREGWSCLTLDTATPLPKTARSFGRIDVFQLAANDEFEGRILAWILAHKRDHSNTRHWAVWRLLEAGWNYLCGPDGSPPAKLSALPLIQPETTKERPE